MPDAFLDTTVFLDDYARNPDVRALVDDIFRGRRTALFSPVSVYEIWLKKMSRAEEAHDLALLSACLEAPFDGHAARIMAGWLAGRQRSGRRYILGDTVIAATAAALGATIYTHNPRDFTRFHANVQSY